MKKRKFIRSEIITWDFTFAFLSLLKIEAPILFSSRQPQVEMPRSYFWSCLGTWITFSLWSCIGDNVLTPFPLHFFFCFGGGGGFRRSITSRLEVCACLRVFSPSEPFVIIISSIIIARNSMDFEATKEKWVDMHDHFISPIVRTTFLKHSSSHAYRQSDREEPVQTWTLSRARWLRGTHKCSTHLQASSAARTMGSSMLTKPRRCNWVSFCPLFRPIFLIFYRNTN